MATITDLELLKDIQQQFKKHLKRGDYTFIGPSDLNYMDAFLESASFFAENKILPEVKDLRPILENEKAILLALSNVSGGAKEIEIFVVDRIDPLEESIKPLLDYINQYNIDFPRYKRN